MYVIKYSMNGNSNLVNFSFSLLDDLEYAKVKVTGEFLHDKEFYVQPRQRFDEGESHLYDLCSM